MKKSLLLIFILLISLFTVSCGFETTTQHNARDKAEAESIKQLQETASNVESEIVSDAIEESTSNSLNNLNNSNNTSVNNTSNNTSNNNVQNNNVSVTPSDTAPPPSTITVYLSVKCNKVLTNPDLKTDATIPADGIMLTGENERGKAITVETGSTVLDVMKYAQSLGYLTYTLDSLSGNGGYITSINNLYEKSCGNESGWKYSVNNYIAGVSADIKTVKNGNNIVWFYAIKTSDTEN